MADLGRRGASTGVRPRVPDVLPPARSGPRRFSELAGGAPYRVVLNKYYVDELYDAGLRARRAAPVARGGLVRPHVIDGIVNGRRDGDARDRAARRASSTTSSSTAPSTRVAEATWCVGGRVRRLQTGQHQRVSLRRRARACWAASSCGGRGRRRPDGAEGFDGSLGPHVDDLHPAARRGGRPLPAARRQGRHPLDRGRRSRSRRCCWRSGCFADFDRTTPGFQFIEQRAVDRRASTSSTSSASTASASRWCS